MAHSSESRWTQAAAEVADASQSAIDALLSAEGIYQDLLEVYNYAGGTDQTFADLLFKEEWESRIEPNVQATMTVDVTGGAVTAVTITNAGSGYLDGTGFSFVLNTTAGGGDGAAEIEYDVVGGSLTNATVGIAGTTYADGAGQTVDEVPLPTETVYETQANADEVAKVADLRLAIQALHELHDAANNQVIAQEDRFAQLRRMS